MYNCFCHEVRYVITVLDNIEVMHPPSKKEEINSRPKCYAQRCRGGEHTVVSQGAGMVEKLVREDFMWSFMSSFGILSMKDISNFTYNGKVKLPSNTE